MIPLTYTNGALIAFCLLAIWISISNWKSKQTWGTIAWYDRRAGAVRLVFSLVLPLAVLRWSLIRSLNLTDFYSAILSLLSFYVSFALFILLTGNKLTRGPYATWAAHLGRFYSRKVQVVFAFFIVLGTVPSFLLLSLPHTSANLLLAFVLAYLFAIPSWRSAVRGTWIMCGALLGVLGLIIGWLQSNHAALPSIHFAPLTFGITSALLTPLALGILPWIDIALIHRLNAANYPETARRALWLTFASSALIDLGYLLYKQLTFEFPPLITESLGIVHLIFITVTLAYIWQGMSAVIVRDIHHKESLQTDTDAVAYFRLYIILFGLATYFFSLTPLQPQLLLIAGGSILPTWFFMWIAKKKLASSAGLLSIIFGFGVGMVWWLYGIGRGSFLQPVYIWDIVPIYPAFIASLSSFFFQNLYVRRTIFRWKF